MISLASEIKVDTTILKSAKNKNNLVRKNRDWEKMEGRAISKE